MNEKALLLLILLNICHWVADYTHLSTYWMLSAKRTGAPLFPIFIHAAVHMMLMSVVVIFFTNSSPIMATVLLLQLITHFSIDVLKGKLNVWFPTIANPANKIHWYVFGADQLAHQIVIITMTYLLTQ